jgi:hypothetical protein
MMQGNQEVMEMMNKKFESEMEFKLPVKMKDG